tara:strand:+ start:15089 stop:17713 length:2625 start_codon:yes stop_codon:yes gene_type:complete
LDDQVGIKLDNNYSENIKSVEFLKEISLDLLQKLSGELWTDYNIHDPGITTLEILCYVITELGYRSENKIKDIFSSDEVENDSFFKAHQILNSGAISFNDIKKLLLDFDEVRNIKIQISKKNREVQSVYSLWIELMDTSISQKKQAELKNKITMYISSKRFLGIDFDDIHFLKNDLVAVDLEIEVSKKLPKNQLFKSIIGVVDYYFSPLPSFKSIDFLLSNGFTSTDIFLGPSLKNGFLTNKSVEENKIKKQLYISDLINSIMNVDSVQNITKISLADEKGNNFNWVYKVKNDCVARLDLSKSSIKFKYRNNLLYKFEYDYSANSFLATKTKVAHKNNKLTIEKGRKVDLISYRSIQYDFPSIYGVGELGVPSGWDEEKIAYTKQFKSFLSFFDQVLANYFAQLNHLPKLFSLDDISTTNAVQWIEDIPKPYLIFKPFLENYLLKNDDLKDENNLQNEWKNWIDLSRGNLANFLKSIIENKENFLERRKKILDHLLARFGYDFSTFDNVSLLTDQELISHKLKILKNLPSFGTSKYYGPLFNDFYNQFGFKNYLTSILGLRGKSEPFGSMVSQLIDIDKTNSVDSIGLQFSNTNFSVGIANLFKFGIDRDFYFYEKGSISLLDNQEKEICKILSSKKKNKKLLIDKLSKKLKSIDEKSENLYLYDHITLRPSPELKVFGFIIKKGESNIFYSPLSLTKSQLQDDENFFLEEFNNLEYYKIIELGHNQFKIIFNCKHEILSSNKFFESEQEAKDKLEDYISFLSSVKSLSSCISVTTKYNYIYNETDDPFSNIISVVLPNWPSRFQSNSFKSYVNKTILDEAPSNIFVNIKWLSYEEILNLEKRHLEFINCDANDFILKEVKLEQLLLLLMNNDR